MTFKELLQILRIKISQKAIQFIVHQNSAIELYFFVVYLKFTTTNNCTAILVGIAKKNDLSQIERQFNKLDIVDSRIVITTTLIIGTVILTT